LHAIHNKSDVATGELEFKPCVPIGGGKAAGALIGEFGGGNWR
jgi:hypothetical protein